jgi:ATP-grasp domain, R2K clade family 3
MNTTGLNLLIPDKPDVEHDAIANAFASSGGTVHRIARFWDPPHFEASTVRVYGAEAFCLVLQQKLGFELCSPSDELLLTVPARFLNRQIARRPLGEIPSVDFPAFIKPVIPKQFRGAVYHSGQAVAEECRGLPPETAVFVAEAVTFAGEVRAFVLDGVMLDAAVYEGRSDLIGAGEFAPP